MQIYIRFVPTFGISSGVTKPFINEKENKICFKTVKHPDISHNNENYILND